MSGNPFSQRIETPEIRQGLIGAQHIEKCLEDLADRFLELTSAAIHLIETYKTKYPEGLSGPMVKLVRRVDWRLDDLHERVTRLEKDCVHPPEPTVVVN